MSDAVTIEAEGQVRILTMNRPDSLNAFDDDLHAGLPAALREAESDREARVIVLTGAGRAFSAGGNLDDFALLAGDLELRRATLRTGRRLFEDLISVQLPVIAAVNGPAVGLGCTIATACDFVLVSDTGIPRRSARSGGTRRGRWRRDHVAAQRGTAAGQAVPAHRRSHQPRGRRRTGARHPCRAGGLVDGRGPCAGPQACGAAAAGCAGHEGRPEPASAHGCGHLLELRARSREPVTRHSRVPRSARHVPRTEEDDQWTSRSPTSRPSCRRSLRRFLTKYSSEAAVRAQLEDPAGYDRDLWRRMGGELGLQGLAIPEQFGGQWLRLRRTRPRARGDGSCADRLTVLRLVRHGIDADLRRWGTMP